MRLEATMRSWTSRLLKVAAIGALAAEMATHHRTTAAAEPEMGGVFVLDDSDPEFKDKDAYSDGFSLVDRKGAVKFRIGGLNGCQSIGSNHLIARDRARNATWVLEIVAHQIRRFDGEGKQLLLVKEIDASAAAVEPETGHLWVLSSKGSIYGDKTVVINLKGEVAASYDARGFDIDYDSSSKAFWIAGQNLTRISALTGEVAFAKNNITAWCASSLTVNAKTGEIWVAVRKHPQLQASNNGILIFDGTGDIKESIQLGDVAPFRVSADSKSGNVWVVNFRKSVFLYSSSGRRLDEFYEPALTCEADPATGGAWVVTPMEIVRLDGSGRTVATVRHENPTDQAWIARE